MKKLDGQGREVGMIFQTHNAAAVGRAVFCASLPVAC